MTIQIMDKKQAAEARMQAASGETIAAYSDCNTLAEASRDLAFRSDIPLTFKQWCSVMEMACDHYGEGVDARAYNEFGVPRIRKHVGAYADQLAASEYSNTKFFAAREGSVCVYIEGQARTLRDIAQILKDKCCADETTFELTSTYICQWSGKKKNEIDWDMNFNNPKSQKILRVWWD